MPLGLDIPASEISRSFIKKKTVAVPVMLSHSAPTVVLDLHKKLTTAVAGLHNRRRLTETDA
jgi:hypothetical protein